MKETDDMNKFLSLYRFDPAKAGWIGVEVEAWVVDPKSKLLAPIDPRVFEHSTKHKFKPELPSQQIEFNTEPQPDLASLYVELKSCYDELRMLAREYGFKTIFCPLPPTAFDMTVFPMERYRKIQCRVPAERLRSAWVAGIHLHFGMRSMSEAIAVVNQITPQLEDLLIRFEVNKERMDTYKKMAGCFVAPVIRDEAHFFKIASESGFASDPRSCWWLIRVNAVGTVEFRFFDSTDDVRRVVFFAEEIGKLISAVERHY